MTGREVSGWLPRPSCTTACSGGRPGRASPLTVALRLVLAVLLLPLLPLLALPSPRLQRRCCRLMLWCFGVRLRVSGGPIRNLRGMLVVCDHVSWLDVLVVGALCPGSFVARADLIAWPGVGRLARIIRVIPIERTSLRKLPGVVDAVAARLRAGGTVVAFPEGTTWCGPAHAAAGRFYPALFQAAVDAARPVQPLQLSYRHRDETPSTVPAFVGDDTLPASMRRLISAPGTVAQVRVGSLQLPGPDRRELAGRCRPARTGAQVGHRRPW